MDSLASVFAGGPAHKEFRITRYDIGWAEGYANYREYVDTDDSPTALPYQQITYPQYVSNSQAVHYYRLGEVSGTTASDAGTTPRNGTYNVNASNNLMRTAGGVTGDPDIAKSLSGDDNRHMDVAAGLALGAPGGTTAFSVEFLFMPTSDSTQDDGLMGWYASNAGFIVTYQGNDLTIRVGNSTGRIVFGSSGNAILKRQWNHVVFTVDASGVATLYIRGVVYSKKTLNGGAMRVPPSNTNFNVGSSQGYQTIPKFGIDEIAVYGRVLSNSEVLEHWQRTVVGKGITSDFYPLNTPVAVGSTSVTLNPVVDIASALLVGQRVTLTDGSYNAPEEATVSAYDATTGVLTLTTGVTTTGHTGLYFQQPLLLLRNAQVYSSQTYVAPPSLVGKQDVTSYVVGYQISATTENLLTNLALTLDERYGESVLHSLFQAMSYVTVEERYTNPLRGLDTGYVSRGHFITDGPLRQDIDASGQRQTVCQGRSPIKLAMLDVTNHDIVPDVIKVPRREATLTYQDASVVVYRMTRAGTTNNQFYYNWVDKPRTRIWASGFTYSQDDVSAGDTLPIKSGDGSIQVVGGAGQVIFNTNAFRAKVKDQGYGNPNKIELEFYRFASPEDVTFAVVAPSGVSTSYQAGKPTKSTILLDASAQPLSTSESYEGRTIIVKSGSARGSSFTIIRHSTVAGKESFDLGTVDGLIPDLMTFPIATGDLIQITDANLWQDAMAKHLYRRGFQSVDATKPLYIDIQAPNAVILVSPLYHSFRDGVKDDSLLQTIADYAPPNHLLVSALDGSTVARTILQKPVGQEDYDITFQVTSLSPDSSDYGIYNRVIAVGEGTGNYNLALHSLSGGSAISGAYKLTAWAWGKGTISQSQADGYVAQVFDNDPKSPQVGGNSPYNYGGLFQIVDGAKRWDFDGMSLLWWDIGKNANTGNPWEIDQLDLTSFSTYRDGTVITQSVVIDYLTEDDYTVLTGHVPSANPKDSEATIRANMLTLKDSPFWKVFADEFSTPDGTTSITEFENDKNDKPRFLRLRAGQSWFRYSDSSSGARSYISVAGIKTWLSREIVQSAEVGIDQRFVDADSVALKRRLRRRSVVLDKNVSLESIVQAKRFAVNELVELKSEFEPYQIEVTHTDAWLHTTTKVVNPETGAVLSFLVRAVSRDHTGRGQLTLVNYLNTSD